MQLITPKKTRKRGPIKRGKNRQEIERALSSKRQAKLAGKDDNIIAGRARLAGAWNGWAKTRPRATQYFYTRATAEKCCAPLWICKGAIIFADMRRASEHSRLIWSIVTSARTDSAWVSIFPHLRIPLAVAREKIRRRLWKTLKQPRI